MTRKFKNQLSNICGLILAVSGAIAGLGPVVDLPSKAMTGAIIVAAISGSIIGWLTGKPVK